MGGGRWGGREGRREGEREGWREEREEGLLLHSVYMQRE